MKLLPESLLAELAVRAAASPRARAHYNIHSGPADPVQRFIVVAQRAAYFRPHRHRARAELAMLLRGRVSVLTFDAHGQVLTRHAVGAGTGTLAYETPPATWHTLVADADGTAFLEVKEGPYDPATASEFAPWSPAEGAADVPPFQEWLRNAQPGDRAPG